jgi:hypothetical protein
LAAWAAAALIAFRAVVISSFDLVFGGRGDGRLIVYLHEHLFKALQGRADFLSPPIFYPQRHGLGFTDAFVLDVLPYAAFRAIGLDPFLSVQTWAIVLSLFCFLASLIIGTRYLRLRLYFCYRRQRAGHVPQQSAVQNRDRAYQLLRALLRSVHPAACALGRRGLPAGVAMVTDARGARRRAIRAAVFYRLLHRLDVRVHSGCRWSACSRFWSYR